MLQESSARPELSLWDINNIREAMRTVYQIPVVEGEYIAIVHPRVIYGKNWRAVLRRRGRMRRAWLRYYCREAHRLRHLVDRSDTTDRILGWAYVNGYFRRGAVRKGLVRKWDEEVKKFEGSGL